MTSGIVFDIKEFAVHDGPGLRTTVFMKGCPLVCSWCHNPESQWGQPQLMRTANGTRLAGSLYTAEQLAARLNQQAALLKANEGGITFSGGEPLMQAGFVAEVISLLEDMHIVLDTSGFGRERDFRLLLGCTDLAYYDLKLIDPEAHVRYVGQDNRWILRNLQIMSEAGVPFVIRVPLVPGVTDSDENLAAIAERVAGLPGLQRVDLLPYNKAAGAKYEAAGMEFKPDYDENRPLNLNTGVFERAGINVRIA